MTLRVAYEQMTSPESIRASSDCGCVTPDYPSDDELDVLIDPVSDAIARLSGMRVRGRVQYIARPCRTQAHCGFFACACCGLDAIPLGDADPHVDQVYIDGVLLPSSEYALHSSLIGWNLVRLRSSEQIALNVSPRDWPSWQDRWRNYASTTDTPTFAVLFTTGCHIDDVYVERAANELVCDLLTEYDRDARALPAGTISADVGGVSLQVASDRISQITETLQRISAGQLGPAFTRMMALLAPNGRSTAAVFSPELLGGWDLGLSTVTP